MRHTFPDGYQPANYCRECGNDFTGITQFDLHRTGSHTEDTRRCMTEVEMADAGLEVKTTRDGVQLWRGVQTDDDRARLAALHERRVEVGHA